MTAALAQFGASDDKEANLRAISSFTAQAAQNGASMLLLPEFSMFYAKTNHHSLIKTAAEPLDGSFVAALGALARRYGL